MTALQWAVIQANLNPAIGTEQKGTRPVLIVSNEDYNQTVPNVTVLPLTSTNRRLYPSEILLPADKAGQPVESIMLAHQIRTISKQRLGRLLGYLEDVQLRQEIHKAIKEHLDMD
jgi:mRNA interferase MazF